MTAVTASVGAGVVVLENELLRVGVRAGRGAEICEFLHKPSGTDAVPAWEPREPGTAPVEPGLASFFDHYRGGWQEVLPNGGPPSAFGGVEYGQHGEACELLWHAEVEDRATARFQVALTRSPLTLEKRLSLEPGSATLRVDEVLTNDGAAAQRAMWGQHLAFGPPFIGPGDRIEIASGVRVIPHRFPAPARRRVAGGREHRWPTAVDQEDRPLDLSVVPRAGAPTEMLYLVGLPEGRYAVATRRGLRLTVEWDLEAFPYLWIWQELGAHAGYPWYGRAYLIGIEPFSSYPSEGLPAAVDNGTALAIPAGGRLSAGWSVTLEPRGGGR